MSVDLVLWILATACFIAGTFRADDGHRINVVSLGLALAAITFIT